MTFELGRDHALLSLRRFFWLAKTIGLRSLYRSFSLSICISSDPSLFCSKSFAALDERGNSLLVNDHDRTAKPATQNPGSAFNRPPWIITGIYQAITDSLVAAQPPDDQVRSTHLIVGDLASCLVAFQSTR